MIYILLLRNRGVEQRHARWKFHPTWDWDHKIAFSGTEESAIENSICCFAMFFDAFWFGTDFWIPDMWLGWWSHLIATSIFNQVYWYQLIFDCGNFACWCSPILFSSAWIKPSPEIWNTCNSEPGHECVDTIPNQFIFGVVDLRPNDDLTSRVFGLPLQITGGGQIWHDSMTR